MLSVLLLGVLLTLAGCGGPRRSTDFAPRIEPGRTSFLTRVHDDCLAGHPWACDLLNDLARGLQEHEQR